MIRCACHGIRLVLCPNRQQESADENERRRQRVRAELDRANVLAAGDRYRARRSR